MLVSTLLVHTALATPAQAWRVALRSPAGGIHPDRYGNLFTSRYIRLPGSNATSSVLKIDRTGHLAWTHRLRGTSPEPSDELHALVPTADGDAVAAGAVQDVDGVRFVVARLAGTDGRERWRTRLQGATSPSSRPGRYLGSIPAW